MINRQASCSDIFEPDLIPVEQARKHILSQVHPLTGYEVLAIEKARNRTLAETIIAPFNVPPHANSAVDGFAINSQDIPQQGIKTLPVAGRIHAGNSQSVSCHPGQCYRIMTGARIPEGADTVVMQEHVNILDQAIQIDYQIQPGSNIRQAGEDLAKDETILSPGKLLTPPDIGLLASLSLTEVKVSRKLRVAIASTGNEIYEPGEPLQPGTIYDSNRYSLLAALSRPDIEIIDLGILQDDPDLLLQQFNKTSLIADVIISSGGVSVGEADFTKTALKSAGQIEFWKLAMKPGRPMAFGQLNDCLFFGLPGNPVAVMVTFYLFVLPALEKQLGVLNKPIAPEISVKTCEPIRKRKGRTEVVRGILEYKNREWQVRTTGKQGSGILRSMSQANAFIILEHDRKTVKAGEYVTVQPFAGLL